MALTAIVPVALLLVIVVSMKLIKQGGIDNSSFMSLPYTNAIKGVACIIVVIVHIPSEYGNPLQDAFGSFAYIGVTLFFLISAYGCSYGVRKSGRRYLYLFWTKRIIALFVPALIVNLLHLVLEIILGEGFSPSILLNVNGYILATLAAYLIFWLVWLIKGIPEKVKDCIIVALVVIGSLLTRLTPISVFQGWPTESMGFAWGILLFHLKDKLHDLFWKHTLLSILILVVVSAGLGIAYLKFKSVYFTGDYLLKIVLGVALILLIFAISIRFTFVGKPLQFLGHISYGVYLLHGIVMAYLSLVLTELRSGFFILLTYALTIIVATAITFISQILIKLLNRALSAVEKKITARKESSVTE